jgi:hypothetical protein
MHIYILYIYIKQHKYHIFLNLITSKSNPHSVFGDFLNGKKFVCDSNLLFSFNHPLTAGHPTE